MRIRMDVEGTPLMGTLDDSATSRSRPTFDWAPRWFGRNSLSWWVATNRSGATDTVP